MCQAGGNLLSASALHDVCTFEEALLAYARERDYCVQDMRSGECCPVNGYARATSFMLRKPCASITDQDLSTLVASARACAARDTCRPKWRGDPPATCATVADCHAIDPCDPPSFVLHCAS